MNTVVDSLLFVRWRDSIIENGYCGGEFRSDTTRLRLPNHAVSVPSVFGVLAEAIQRGSAIRQKSKEISDKAGEQINSQNDHFASAV